MGNGGPSKKELTIRRCTYLENTLVALRAVMCSLGLPPHRALLATVQSSCINIVWHFNICRNVPWICKSASQVRKYRHQTQTIENYEASGIKCCQANFFLTVKNTLGKIDYIMLNDAL